MTLEAYDPDRLDQLSLRVLDVCARLRTLARQSRDEELPAVDLHDRKALEWLENLEAWLYRAEADMSQAIVKHRGQRHAKKAQSRPK